MFTIHDLLTELDYEAPTTRQVLARVPEARLDWRPYEKSLTLGQLAMHVAIIPGAIAEMSTQPTLNATVPIPRPTASTVAQLGKTLDDSLAKAHVLLGAMTDADLAKPWRAMVGKEVVRELSRGQLLRSMMFNHWYHHRGQLLVYLRGAGALVPAVFGPSADEGAPPR